MKKKADYEIRQIDRRIEEIKTRLQKIGEMRSGSLTRQYRVPKDRVGPYYQVSYTHQMKSRTEYVRPRFVAKLRDEIATFKRFKKLVAEWTDLAIRQSKLKMKLANIRVS